VNPAGQTKPPPTAAFIFAFAAVYLIWGSTYMAIRIAVAVLPPFLLAGARFHLRLCQSGRRGFSGLARPG
jgi:hypothetical protein